LDRLSLLPGQYFGGEEVEESLVYWLSLLPGQYFGGKKIVDKLTDGLGCLSYLANILEGRR
jgi:hypothetical protein